MGTIIFGRSSVAPRLAGFDPHQPHDCGAAGPGRGLPEKVVEVKPVLAEFSFKI